MFLASDPVGASGEVGVSKVVAVVIDLESAQEEAERAVTARRQTWNQGDCMWRCYVV